MALYKYRIIIIVSDADIFFDKIVTNSRHTMPLLSRKRQINYELKDGCHNDVGRKNSQISEY